MLKKMMLFLVLAIIVEMTGDMAEAGYYNLQVVTKEVVTSDPCIIYYAADIGNADPCAVGKQIYTVLKDKTTLKSALCENKKVGSNWSQTTVDGNSDVLYTDLEVGNVSSSSNKIGNDEVYYMAENHFKTAYLTTGYQWTLENMEDLVGVVDFVASRSFGGLVIGKASNPDANGRNQVWFGSKWATSWDGVVLGCWMNTPGSWSTKLYQGNGIAVAVYDITIGERFALLQPDAGNCLTWADLYTAQTVDFPPGPNSSLIWEDGWFGEYPRWHFRSAAIGDIRPETNPGDGNDPWYGNELIRGASKDMGWPPDPERDPNGWRIWVNNWRNWTDSGIGPYSAYWIERVIAQDVTSGGVSKFIRRIATGDLDDDGLDEFVIAAYGTLPELTIYSWDDVTSAYKTQVLDTSREYYDVRVRDIDGNGRLDILYAADGEVGILYNIATLPGVIDGDINGDNRVDMIDFALLAANWLVQSGT